MDKKDILERKKQIVLEAYELDSQLAPCVDFFERKDDEIEFSTKENFSCDGCASEICFVLLEEGEVDEPNVMYG